MFSQKFKISCYMVLPNPSVQNSTKIHSIMSNVLILYWYVPTMYYKVYSPVTSSVLLPLAITGELALITTSHWITLPSSLVLNCEIV